MSSAAKPWMKFYPQDWRADEKLRLCSLAARGLWMEMLAIMHRSERYGQLLIGGIVPTDAQLAVQVGASPDEVTALIRDLETAGVFSRAASGAIYSRRMTRDGKKAEIARRNGKSGGNPKLSKQTDNSPSDKGGDKPPDKGGVKPQRPEARGQKEPPNPHGHFGPPEDLRQVMDAGGFAHPPSDAGLLREWYSAGADLASDILPTVTRIASQEMARSGRAPFKLKLFDDAIRRKVAEDAAEIDRLRRMAERARRIDDEQGNQRSAGGSR